MEQVSVLEDQLMQSDNFVMYEVKVVDCTKSYPHDFTACPWLHPGERARRRDPRLFKYSSTLCPDVKKDKVCSRGISCPYAHNIFEYFLHPDRYRTRLCDFGEQCTRKLCFFAHTPAQLRVTAKSAAQQANASNSSKGKAQGKASSASSSSTDLQAPSVADSPAGTTAASTSSAADLLHASAADASKQASGLVAAAATGEPSTESTCNSTSMLLQRLTQPGECPLSDKTAAAIMRFLDQLEAQQPSATSTAAGARVASGITHIAAGTDPAPAPAADAADTAADSPHTPDVQKLSAALGTCLFTQGQDTPPTAVELGQQPNGASTAVSSAGCLSPADAVLSVGCNGISSSMAAKPGAAMLLQSRHLWGSPRPGAARVMDSPDLSAAVSVSVGLNPRPPGTAGADATCIGGGGYRLLPASRPPSALSAALQTHKFADGQLGDVQLMPQYVSASSGSMGVPSPAALFQAQYLSAGDAGLVLGSSSLGSLTREERLQVLSSIDTGSNQLVSMVSSTDRSALVGSGGFCSGNLAPLVGPGGVSSADLGPFDALSPALVQQLNLQQQQQLLLQANMAVAVGSGSTSGNRSGGVPAAGFGNNVAAAAAAASQQQQLLGLQGLQAQERQAALLLQQQQQQQACQGAALRPSQVLVSSPLLGMSGVLVSPTGLVSVQDYAPAAFQSFQPQASALGLASPAGGMQDGSAWTAQGQGVLNMLPANTGCTFGNNMYGLLCAVGPTG